MSWFNRRGPEQRPESEMENNQDIIEIPQGHALRQILKRDLVDKYLTRLTQFELKVRNATPEEHNDAMHNYLLDFYKYEVRFELSRYGKISREAVKAEVLNRHPKFPQFYEASYNKAFDLIRDNIRMNLLSNPNK